MSVFLAPEVGSLVELLRILQEIDVEAEDAELNKVSIDDNNGGRIML